MKLTHGKADKHEVRRVVRLGNKEIQKNGWDGGLGSLYVDFRHSFFAVQDDKRIVSILVYMVFDGAIWVNMAWTDPEYRQKGYYTLLWHELVRKIKRSEYTTIKGAFHHTNNISRAMQEKQGRKPSQMMNERGFYLTTFEV